jgi:hypothetical protein
LDEVLVQHIPSENLSRSAIGDKKFPDHSRIGDRETRIFQK